MDNENELLALWIGWEPSKLPEFEGLWLVPAGDAMDNLPSFRTSNEWAGALLEKLGGIFDVGLEKANRVWSCRVFGPNIFNSADTWRAAVVDAALEVIRREDKGTAK